MIAFLLSRRIMDDGPWLDCYFNPAQMSQVAAVFLTSIS